VALGSHPVNSRVAEKTRPRNSSVAAGTVRTGPSNVTLTDAGALLSVARYVTVSLCHLVKKDTMDGEGNI
jgi:hypothetical protein